MLKTSISLLFLMICMKCSFGQFEIRYNNQEINYANANVKYAFLNTTSFTDSTLKSINKNVWLSLKNNKISLSYISQTTWLKIPLSSLQVYGGFHYININNPHINYLKCWIVKDDSIVKNFNITGDNKVYSTRQLPATSFVFPVNNNMYKNCFFVVAADKRFTKLDLPIIFCTESYYLNNTISKIILTGLLIGLCLLLLLYNVYLFITVRQRLYLWYSIFLVLLILYITADGGILFKYILPNYTKVNDLVRPLIFAIIEFPMMLFFLDLMSLKKRFAALYKFNIYLLLAYFVVIVISIILLNNGGFEVQGMLLKLINYLGPSLILLTLFQTVFLVIKKVPFSVFALISYLSFSFFIVLFSLQQREFLVTNSFTKYCNYWAIFSEAILGSFLLAWNYKLYSDEAKSLLQKNLKLQQDIFTEVATWQEKEMSRLSSVLHDTVGANLGYLRLEVDNMPLTKEGKSKIASLITTIGSTVREMSHSFSPIFLQKNGLYKSISNHVELINRNANFALVFEWIGKTQLKNSKLEVVVYQIIQELLQNLLKHAKATSATLQVLVAENLISIYLEDNGVGFEVDEKTDGIGLNSIKNLLELLNGKLLIDTKENQGCCISIEITYIYDEKI